VDPDEAITEVSRSNNIVSLLANGGLCANFQFQPASGFRPLSVSFTDTSDGNIEAWHWDFGDGSTSIQQNPTHIYAANGAYDVTLLISGPGGSDELTYHQAILVYSPSQAEFSATPLYGTAPLEISFTDQSTGDITNWQWDFGDGSVSTAQNPIHLYSYPGSYTVILTVTGPGGTDTVIKIRYVNLYAPAIANFVAYPTHGIAPLEVAFIDLSSGNISDYYWEFGDGITSTLQNPTHIYQRSGTYTVSLTVSGHGGTDKEIKIGYINVQPVIHKIYLPLVTRGNNGLTANLVSQPVWTLVPTLWRSFAGF
jgi:PKD repeat protein